MKMFLLQKVNPFFQTSASANRYRTLIEGLAEYQNNKFSEVNNWRENFGYDSQQYSLIQEKGKVYLSFINTSAILICLTPDDFHFLPS